MRKGLFLLCLFALVLVSSPAFAASDLLSYVCVDRENHSDIALARAECDSEADARGYVHGVLKPAVCPPCPLCELPPTCEALQCPDSLTKYECDGVAGN